MSRGHDDPVPEDERDALLTIAHGAVVTSGGVSAQRVLTTTTEFLLARGLGPVAYGVYALAWRIAQLLIQLVTLAASRRSSDTCLPPRTTPKPSHERRDWPTPRRWDSER